jgi:16S rRNA processing protein RimM
MGDRLVAIGEVMRAHGLGGALRVRALTDRPERFDRLTECIVWEPDEDIRTRRAVEEVRGDGDAIIVKLEGIDSPEAARALRGRLLAIAESEALPLPPGYFYPWQLAGCRVETTEGIVVGEVRRIEPGTAQDLWVVADGAREHLVPAVPDIVVDVDLGARRIVIRPPEGLLEL